MVKLCGIEADGVIAARGERALADGISRLALSPRKGRASGEYRGRIAALQAGEAVGQGGVGRAVGLALAAAGGDGEHRLADAGRKPRGLAGEAVIACIGPAQGEARGVDRDFVPTLAVKNVPVPVMMVT